MDWKVIKWDEHRFFGYVSGRGFKGVDFMALRNEELYLMEVKNYRDRRPQDEQHPFDLVLADSDFYGEIFLQKFTDSFALIEIIKKYYLRDFIFWTRAAEIIRNHPEHVHLVLWLEPGPKIPLEKYVEGKEKLHAYFKKNPIFPKGVTIRIQNRNDPAFNLKVEIEST